MKSGNPDAVPAAGPSRLSPSGPEAAFVPRTDWDRRLLELLEFRRVNGHVNVPRGWPANVRLANWVNNQRRLVRLGLLPPARGQRLEDFGIAWEGLDARRELQQETWDRMFGALRTFRRCFGHLDVPRGWKVEPSLAAWLANQRYLLRTGELPEPRRRSLQELDPEWHRAKARPGPSGSEAEEGTEPAMSPWERSFAALREVRRRVGTCDLPARSTEAPALAKWVARQRMLRRRGRLAADRIRRLEDLGFAWSGEDRLRARRIDAWEARVESLATFVARHGHVRVPLEGTAGLGAWLHRQRQRARQGALSAEQRRRLESLGVFRTDRERVWNESFDRYLRLSGRSGKSSEPLSIAERRRLYRWISTQRAAWKAGQLPASRLRRLEESGCLHPAFQSF